MNIFRLSRRRLPARACLALALAAVSGLLAQTPPTPVAPLVAIPAAGNDAEMVGNLSLADNPLSTVLDLLERLTGRSVIRPQALPTPTFTFNSRTPMSKRDAIIAIESLLTINGIAVAPMGEKFIKVVPVGNVRTEAPELVVGSLRDRPATGLIVSKLFRLTHLDTQSFQTQIQPFLGTGATVVPFQNSSTVLVTDTISNLQRLEYVLGEVDKPRNLVTKFYTLKFALSQAVSEKIKSMIETTKTAFNRQAGQQAPGGAALPTTPAAAPGSDMSAGLGAALLSATTSLNFDERTNQVILVSDPGSVPFFDNLIEKLDVQAAPNTKIEVIQIQHADASEIAAMIGSFATGSVGGVSSSRRSGTASTPTSRNRNTRASQTGGRSTFPNQRPTPPPMAQPAMPQTPGGVGERTSQFSEFMTIMPDERSNAIVVSGTQDDLNLIRELIKQIDVVLPQVQIDVLIASVTLSKSVQRGLDAFDGIEVIGNRVTKIAGITGPGISVKDLLVGNSGGNKRLTGTLRADGNAWNNVQVLSRPSITTTHNQEATITVAKALPIITSSYSDTTSVVGARNSYTYENIGLELTVKPLIGTDGKIQMEIEQSADEVEGYTDNADKQPLIAKRSAKSFVTVADGEIIYLGGLQKDSNAKSRNGFPIVSELPLIGALFGSNLHRKERDEIIFFIQPRVVRTTDDADRVARETLMTAKVREMVQPHLAKGHGAEPVAPAEEAGKQ